MKKMIEIQNEMMGLGQGNGTNLHHSNIVAVNSVDWTRPQVEVDFERDLVMQWLIHTVKLPQYAETFFGQGYEDMRAIQAINSREQLARCGIKLDGHQTLIMAEIAALQGAQFGTRGGDRTRGEGGGQAKNRDAFGGKLPPLPPMMGDDPNNAQYAVDGEGIAMTNVWDEDVFETNYVQATVTYGSDEVPPAAAADVPLVLETPCWNGVGGPPPPPMMSGKAMQRGLPPPPPQRHNDATTVP
eukprot:275670_1